MARVKISEFIAKTTLLPGYRGFAATPNTRAAELARFFPDANLVVKIDQGVKKRGKLGLVRVNCTPRDCVAAIRQWSKSGWSQFLVEPVVEHASDSEHYLALERVRSGWAISTSDHGGVDIESAWDTLHTTVFPSSPPPSHLASFLRSLLPLLDQFHVSFLEMNPIIVRGESVTPLDMACEVDSAGSLLPPLPDRFLSASERAIAALDAATPASLKFRLLNPQGKIWMLLSGGGASLVLADEVADLGLGTELANYGEYSGAPTDDDVYSYTKLILTTMLHHPSPITHQPLALVIAAGVANFTDVAKTFRGIIRAMDEVKTALLKAKVKVFVRRGGPNETKGLKAMGDFLTGAGIPHLIHTHVTPITQVISEVKEYL